jgi:hypothetical protein
VFDEFAKSLKYGIIIEEISSKICPTRIFLTCFGSSNMKMHL